MLQPERMMGDSAAMLRDSLRGFLARQWSVDAARAAEPDAGLTLWRKLTGQGFCSLGCDGETGLREMTIVMSELGRAACPSPMLATCLANLAFHGRTKSGPKRLLEAIHAGSARPAWSFGARDHDRNAGRIAVEDGRASGKVRFVEAPLSCTHLIVALRDSVGIVDLRATGVALRPTRAMGAWGLCEVELTSVTIDVVDIEATRLDDLETLAKLLVLARAYGAARRSFELVVGYAEDRRQFGQPIGKFQAIQHKLADCFIDLEGVRLTLNHAAALRDREDGDWHYFAHCAAAFATDALRRVSLQTHHTFGAVGYADEHEAPLHFKRVHLDTTAMGGARPARRAVARFLLDQGGRTLPQYDLGPAGNAFREQVQRWLDEHWTGDRKAAYDERPFAEREFDPSFARDAGKTGWIALGWPDRFGGQARSPLEQIAFMETMERAEAPRIGAAIQANALMHFGNLEQQRRYLPEIRCGEAMHGMGYSEPQAGSDLAALWTSAVRNGDEWVINGQKIWTTTWWGKYMFVAARTDRDAKPPQAGVSMFVVPMDAKGISVRPSATMYDGTFANIFYDDVRIPAGNLVGEVNGGWKVLTGALAYERGLVGGGVVLKVAHAFERLRQYVIAGDDDGVSLADDPVVREKLAGLASEIEVGRQLMMQCAELAGDGVTPPEYAAMSKVFSSELMERFGESALDILGMRATLSERMPDALDNGRFEQNLRHSLMWVISIGTNEIQRNLIAQRALGLPR